MLACLLSFCLTLAAFSADKENAVEPNGKSAESEAMDAQKALRSYLQLQEQLHSAQLAIEQGRKEADEAARRSAEAIAVRLKLIEEELTTQRDRQQRELESLQGSNRIMLTFAGIFAAIGFLAMLFTSLFQVRAMNRFAEVAAAFSAGHVFGPGSAPASGLAGGEPTVVTFNAAEQSSQRLLGAIERLEQRVHELESTSHPPLAPGLHHNGADRSEGGDATTGGKADLISVMLGKGQALLNLDQPENALTCFDEVIGLDPQNAEALVKKGTALERLKKLEEAIECYDRAIAVDNLMTLAWLYKGGVFNQLERFSEALQCYEQALRTQQKSPVR